MKSIKNSDTLSPFLQSALTLDQRFNEILSMSQQLDEVNLDTEFGMNQARKILVKFGETGEKLGDAIQQLANGLNEAKEAAEQATQNIASRAQAIQARHDQNESIALRFRTLGDGMQSLSFHVAQLMTEKKALSDEEKAALGGQVPQIVSQLGILLEEAVRIKADAKNANLKSLERDAGSLGQSIQAMRDKLSQAVATQH